jgi:hypothetical protein
MSPSRKKILLIFLVLVPAVILLGIWLYRSQTTSEPEPSKPLHTGLGEVLAQETIQFVGTNGNIVLIVHEEGESPEMDVQVDAFKDLIYDTAIKIVRTDSISVDKGGAVPGQGMSGKRLVRLAQKYPQAKAFVSFVGVPDADAEELKQLANPAPLLAFTRSSDEVSDLMKMKILQAAIVPRFQFPAPGPKKPQTNRDWFDKQYQVVRQPQAR